MNEIKKVYGQISKTEDLDDGTIKVWGYASSEEVDSDGEIITSDAMKSALGDYMKFGAVREMHQAKAAGTAIEIEVQEDGRTYFGAHVVDSEAVKKVKTNVYKGFSIGGKVTKRDSLNKTIIKGINLIEISLVDRPANPEAVFTMYKAETLPEGEAVVTTEANPDDVNKAEQTSELNAIDSLADLLKNREISAARLLELAKNDKPNEAGTENLTKGLWTVQDFAGLLATLGWICQDTQSEAEWEGDNSPIPAQLREWLSAGAAIFTQMAQEEISELVANIKTQAGDIDVIQMAQMGMDLQKAGKKFSKDARDKLSKAHDAVKAAGDHLTSLNYEGDDDGDEGNKAEGIEDLNKVAGELDLAKSEITKLETEKETLEKRVKELEALPALGKAVLKAVDKGTDVDPDADLTAKVEPVKDSKGDLNDIATEIKKIHQSGGVVAIHR